MNTRSGNIILIGMMGTGKSTVGRLVADHLNYSLVDLDAEIERMAGKSIPEIFAADGEGCFRDIETAALRAVLQRTSQIIATGGGAVLRPENCEAMKRGGWVVALTADADTIVERVRGDANRPLLAGNVEERVQSILMERADKYRFADLMVDTAGLKADEVAAEILMHYRG